MINKSSNDEKQSLELITHVDIFLCEFFAYFLSDGKLRADYLRLES